MEERNYTVYLHTSPSNKYYIGITSMMPEKRWGNNGVGYKGQVFYYAIEKYGWDNIKHEIIAENLTKEQAEQMEMKLIAEYRSNQREFGYNVANGGNSNGKHSEETKMKIGKYNRNKKLSKETKRKISLKNKGKVLTETHKSKISNALKGNKNPFFGKKHTEETKRKMRNAQTGSKNHNSKRVICDNIIFVSVKECADYYGENDKVMRNWLNGKRKMKQKFIELGLRYYN